MKDDEQRLLIEVSHRCEIMEAGYESVRDIGVRLGINWKRLNYLCLKWSAKGWYDYGVSADLGWLTEAGMAKATALVPL